MEGVNAIRHTKGDKTAASIMVAETNRRKTTLLGGADVRRHLFGDAVRMSALHEGAELPVARGKSERSEDFAVAETQRIVDDAAVSLRLVDLSLLLRNGKVILN